MMSNEEFFKQQQVEWERNNPPAHKLKEFQEKPQEGDEVWNIQKQKYNCYAYAISGKDRIPTNRLPSYPGVSGGQGISKFCPYEMDSCLIKDGLIN